MWFLVLVSLRGITTSALLKVLRIVFNSGEHGMNNVITAYSFWSVWLVEPKSKHDQYNQHSGESCFNS